MNFDMFPGRRKTYKTTFYLRSFFKAVNEQLIKLRMTFCFLFSFFIRDVLCLLFVHFLHMQKSDRL